MTFRLSAPLVTWEPGPEEEMDAEPADWVWILTQQLLSEQYHNKAFESYVPVFQNQDHTILLDCNI